MRVISGNALIQPAILLLKPVLSQYALLQVLVAAQAEAVATSMTLNGRHAADGCVLL